MANAGLIFKGHHDMGNVLYADWVEGNMTDLAGNLNTDKQGDIVLGQDERN